MENCSNQVVRTIDVIGKAVISLDKEKLGKIEEVVLDKVSGQVRYAVLSFGGFLGMGSDYYAIPWNALKYCQTEDAFEISILKDKLKAATGFGKDNWPDFADETWNRSVHTYYDL